MQDCKHIIHYSDATGNPFTENENAGEDAVHFAEAKLEKMRKE